MAAERERHRVGVTAGETAPLDWRDFVAAERERLRVDMRGQRGLNLPTRELLDSMIARAYEAGKQTVADKVKAMSPDESKRWLQEQIAEKKNELRSARENRYKARQKRDDLEKEIDRLRKLTSAYDELCASTSAGIRLEKAQASVFHRLRQSLSDGFFINNPKITTVLSSDDAKAYEIMFAAAHAFVIQHDWAAAFKNAADYDSTLFKLPFEICAFEFRANGHPVIIMATEADDTIYLQLAAETTKGWFSFEKAIPFDEPLEGRDEPISELLDFLRPQIKAVAIALDAEVAEIEIVRAPHKLNQARQKAGRPPLADYHVVSLASRERARRLVDPQNTGVRRRLHFRRGHWRHFETYKTWIRWTLVGDPDLGFVDKEYRL